MNAKMSVKVEIRNLEFSVGESKRNILKYFKLNFDYNSLKGKQFQLFKFT